LSGRYQMGELFVGRETLKGTYEIVTYKGNYEVKKVHSSLPVTCSMN
jgi:hypothetical protein